MNSFEGIPPRWDFITLTKRNGFEGIVFGFARKETGDLGFSEGGGATTESGFGDQREPALGDALETDQRSRWHR